jgi:transcriptional regulator with XRE-family HTH domain
MKIRSPEIRRLGAQLRRARKTAGLTGTQLANQLQWTQSKVSKLELGYQVASYDDVQKWSAACAVDPETREHLEALVRSIRDEQDEWARRIQEDPAGIQEDYDSVARQAVEITNVEIAMIPGLLQTREYARHLMGNLWLLHEAEPDDIEVFLDARMARSAVLNDASKRFEFLISECALRTFPCPTEVMKDQLRAILEVSQRQSTVTIGIIPMAVPLSLPLINCFIIFDSAVAIVESITHEMVHRDDKAHTYQRAADLLRRDALFGDAASELIKAALRALN